MELCGCARVTLACPQAHQPVTAPSPPPQATVQQSLSGPPQPSPQPVQPGGGRSRQDKGPHAAAPAAKLCRVSRSEQHTCWTAAQLASGAPGRQSTEAQRREESVLRRAALGKTCPPVHSFPR